MIRWLHFLLFLPVQASTFARRVDRLHYFIILMTAAVALVIGTVGLTWLIRYRERVPRALTPKITATRGQEAFFVLFPLTFFLLWFFLGFHDYVWSKTPPRDARDVYVVGKQWMWKFSPADGPSSINVLHVPLGRPVRLLITSRDVIHSFFVPAFRIKQDALPGRYTQIWFTPTMTGTFDLECAEYCGLNHSRMLGQVVVMPANAYEQWRSAQGPRTFAADDEAPESNLRALGLRVAEREGCFKCHSVDGTRHIGPTWLDLYGREETLSDGARIQADAAYLTESMMDPRAKIVAGFLPVMPVYQGHLTPGEAAALVEFIKSLRSDRLTPTPSEKPIYAPVH